MQKMFCIFSTNCSIIHDVKNRCFSFTFTGERKKKETTTTISYCFTYLLRTNKFVIDICRKNSNTDILNSKLM